MFKALFVPHERKLIRQMARYIRSGSVVLDIGANAGFYSRGFARAAPGALIVAFEPQSVPRAIFTVASLFKKSRNIILLPLALGRKSGLTELSIPFKPGGKVGISLAHLGNPEGDEDRFVHKLELVSVQTLDDVMQCLDVGPVSMIKIDVEGAELLVLEGAAETIRRHRPVVICEIDNREGRFRTGVADLLQFFAREGYAPYDLETGGRLEGEALKVNTVFKPEAA